MSESLPAGWTTSAFAELNEFNSKSLDPAQFPDEIFELYSVPTFPAGKPEFVTGDAIGSTKQAVAPSDVLVCKINPRINRVWQVMPKNKHRQIASSEWIVMRSPELNSSYLRHFFSSPAFRETFCTDLTGVGGSLTRAQPKRVATFAIPLAPSNEQKRIADKLDTVLARVDACRDRLDRIPAILKRFRQAVLAAATSGKLTEEWRAERVGWADAGSPTNEAQEPRWASQAQPNLRAARDSAQPHYAVTATPDSATLHPGCGAWKKTNVGVLLTDIRYGTAKKCHYEPQATPVIRIPNVCDGRVSHADLKYADFDDGERQKLSLVAGDILMIRSNGSIDLVGRTALVAKEDEGFLYAGYLIRLRVNHRTVNPSYLSLGLSAPEARNEIELTARSTSGVNNINTEEIKALNIELPDLAEQTEIVRRVETLFAYADRLEARYTAARAQVGKLTPATLAKAFRGELVPQDPSDEPASVLLERIRAQRGEQTTIRPKRGRKGLTMRETPV